MTDLGNGWVLDESILYENGNAFPMFPVISEEHAQEIIDHILTSRQQQNDLVATKEVAEELRNDLAELVMTPVVSRDPEVVTDLVQEGIVLTIQTIGERDPELLALATECGNLALAATQQRLAAVFGGG